ncbi:MAG TPA: ribosome biogenesis GTP-binding protein YihA/YsxC [Syntrophales bacterium]|nr:ribosome biogenesis GTP-binding protein YihA/YsxC [Syntrophales bacterium]
MKITCASFVKTATRPNQYPPAMNPELAVAGRSNVGKSSLINALLNRKQLVRTSHTPGRTQALNFFAVNDRFSVVDLPGYGYAKVPEAVRRQWGPMVETYLRVRETLKLVLVVMDSRREPTRDDLSLVGWLRAYRRPWLPVLTKIDKLSRNEARQAVLRFRGPLDLGEGVDAIVFSARTGEGRERLWTAVEEALRSPGQVP